MSHRILPLLLVMLTGIPVFAQDVDEIDIDTLIRKLRDLSILVIDTDSKKMIEQQQEKIELADQILEHPDMEERHRLFAMITRIQSLGIQFNVLYRDKKTDDALNESYAEALEEGLDDDDRRIVIESTSSQASFRSGLFILEPDEEKAEVAADALDQLNELGPKDPLIQAARRLLLEQLWNSDQPKPVFAAISEFDEKLAKIVLDQIDGSSDREKADFLWARHFARFGDFVSQRRLAEMYETGKGTRVNNSQSARWYTKLARLGDRSAQIKLGDFLLQGKGYSIDEAAAVEQYRQAATINSRSPQLSLAQSNYRRVAQFKLGQCYRNGTGVEKSESDWRKWIKSAGSNATSADVQVVYQAIDFKNSADSYKLFYESLVEQNPDDYYYLNNLAYSLLIADNKNPERALELIEKAIELAPEEFGGLANFLDTKATALKDIGETEAAIKIFKSVLEDLDDKQPILESLIECYEKLDDENNAQKYRERLNELPKQADSK